MCFPLCARRGARAALQEALFATRANALPSPAADMAYGCGAYALCCCGEAHRLFKSFEEDEERTRRLAAALEHESTATSLHFALFPRKTRDGGLQPCCREPVVSMMVRRSALRLRARRRHAWAPGRDTSGARAASTKTHPHLCTQPPPCSGCSPRSSRAPSLLNPCTLNPKPETLNPALAAL